MTTPLYRTDVYLKTAIATVTGHTPEGGVILDRCLFYPRGGGQPGDSGRLVWEDGALEVATAVKAPEGTGIVLLPAAPAALPPLGATVEQRLDWDRRHRHMRMHTALHLLSVVLPYPVTGGSIGADKGRLDFNMPDPIDDANIITARLSQLVAGRHDVTEEWITEAELAANPGLVKTMSVAPPTGQGRIRLIRIGTQDSAVDLQPCGGTHVLNTREIGAVNVSRIENKGRMNRRVTLVFGG
jgi:misacylated tRNA(Ala) deacylase